MPAIWIPKRLVEIGLINTAAENPVSFVRHCEIEYESRVKAAAVESIASKCKVIMLTGPSASGKTTTAQKLVDALKESGTHAAMVSLDNFYKNIEDYPRLPDGSTDYENIQALDIDEIHACLNMLIETGSAQFPMFDFETDSRKEERMPLELQGGVVVIEGIHALNPILTDALPRGSVYKIYAGLREEYSHSGQRSLATREIRLARRMVRDHMFRGHGPESTISMWPLVCEGEDQYIKAFKPYADLLLDTSFSYEICLLAPFVEKMRNNIVNEVMSTKLEDLIKKFSRCSSIDMKHVPKNSMLREFLGQ